MKQTFEYGNDIIAEEEAMARDAREQLHESVGETILRNEKEV